MHIKDRDQQMQQIGDERDTKNHQAEDSRELKWKTSIRNWFTGFRIKKKQENVQIIGLFFRVTGEELYRQFEKKIEGIDRRLYPLEITGVTGGSPIIHLPPKEIEKLEFRQKHFSYMMYHVERQRTYYLTGQDISDAELIISQEDFYTGRAGR